MAQHKVSIIMRSFNDAPLIEATLKAVLNQTFKDYELINVDSCSSDGTVDIIRKYNDNVSVAEPGTKYNPGRVLNEAIAKVDSPWVVFCNSDATPQSDTWLEKLIEPLADDKTAATFSRQISRPDATPLVRYDYEKGFPPPGEAHKVGGFFFSLASAAIKREIWAGHKFYVDCDYSEDVHWAWWAANNGYKVVYVPESEAMHSHNYTLKQLRRRACGEGEADVFIYGVQPSLGRQILRWGKHVIEDTVYCLKTGHIGILFTAPISRMVFTMGYHKGTKIGTMNKALLEAQDKASE